MSSTSSVAVQEFARLRDAIYDERERLLARLREIDAALALELRPRDRYLGARTSIGRPRNATSLKEVVLQVIEDKSLTKQEVLDQVLATGYQFTTDDPLNSLGVILYGKNPKFKREGKRFLL